MVHPPEEKRAVRKWSRYGRVSAAEARATARDFLASVGHTDERHADAVLLVVSELVTNAVRHAGGVTAFQLDHSDRGVTVSVYDATDDPPRTAALDPARPGGFGLHLVRGLAGRLEVEWRPVGKRVGATVPLS